MHIAGRLALQSPACAVLPQRETGIAPNPDILSFHGCDIVVRHITEHGFEAEENASGGVNVYIEFIDKDGNLGIETCPVNNLRQLKIALEY